jgi:hypothetical protein
VSLFHLFPLLLLIFLLRISLLILLRFRHNTRHATLVNIFAALRGSGTELLGSLSVLTWRHKHKHTNPLSERYWLYTARPLIALYVSQQLQFRRPKPSSSHSMVDIQPPSAAVTRQENGSSYLLKHFLSNPLTATRNQHLSPRFHVPQAIYK